MKPALKTAFWPCLVIAVATASLLLLQIPDKPLHHASATEVPAATSVARPGLRADLPHGDLTQDPWRGATETETIADAELRHLLSAEEPLDSGVVLADSQASVATEPDPDNPTDDQPALASPSDLHAPAGSTYR